jgi:hypothetical protein
MKILCSRVGNRSFLASGLFPESRKGAQSPNLWATSLQVQLRLGLLRRVVFWHRCGCFRCHNLYLTSRLKKSLDGDALFPSLRQKLYAPTFVTVLNHMERVHLRNRLLGEFKGDVAKIWCCSRR